MQRMDTGPALDKEQHDEGYAPRRDNESEGLSVAMQAHLEGREQWQAVFLRAQEFTMQGKAAEAVVDVRNAYALMSDQAVLAAQQVQTEAKKELEM